MGSYFLVVLVIVIYPMLVGSCPDHGKKKPSMYLFAGRSMTLVDDAFLDIHDP